MDKNTAAKLSKVNPVLSAKIAQLIVNLAALDLDVRVVQGLRTEAEQNALYAQGRTKPGKIVTNAKGFQSNHNYGNAVDLCPFVNDQPDWNATAAFKIIGAEAKKLGLHWGGDWKFKDMPHVEIGDLSVKECLALYNKGGLPAVWGKIGATEPLVFPEQFGAVADSPVKNTPEITKPVSSGSPRSLLQKGDKGAEVSAMQTKLVILGYLKEADGEFGIWTEKAVRAFQGDYNLREDGLCGQNTLAEIEKIYAEKKRGL